MIKVNLSQGALSKLVYGLNSMRTVLEMTIYSARLSLICKPVYLHSFGNITDNILVLYLAAHSTLTTFGYYLVWPSQYESIIA